MVGGFEAGDLGFCEGVGEADEGAVGEGEFGDAGRRRGDFTGGADPGDAGGFAGGDERGVERREVADMFVGIDVGGFQTTGLGVGDLGDEFVAGFLAGGFGSESQKKFGEGADEVAVARQEAVAIREGRALSEGEMDADAEGWPAAPVPAWAARSRARSRSGMVVMRVAEVRTPRLWASRMPSVTPGEKPRSSAFIMRRGGLDSMAKG